MSKILITGAAGFIGSHLVEFLLKDGVKRKDLRLFVLKGESIENLPNSSFDIIYGDIRNKKDVKKALEGDVNVIYHLAAVTRDGEGKYLDVNWRGTRVLLTACKHKKIKKFVLFSSIAVYGLPAFTGEGINISEKSIVQAVGDYAKSKLMAEQEIVKAHEKFKLPYVIVRPTTVYGPRDKAGICQLYKAIKSGYFVIIGDGKNKMDYVYVGDLVKGARLAQLNKSNTGDYILGGIKPVTFSQISQQVAASIDKKIFKWHIPKVLGYKFAIFVETVNKLTGYKLPMSVDRVTVMTSNYYFDISKARKEIKYHPIVSLKKGMRLTAQSLKL